jgi:hypothetical protein
MYCIIFIVSSIDLLYLVVVVYTLINTVNTIIIIIKTNM